MGSFPQSVITYSIVMMSEGRNKRTTLVAQKNPIQTSLVQLSNFGDVVTFTTNCPKKVSFNPTSSQDLTLTVGGIRKY
jgi:hypothetical protein